MVRQYPDMLVLLVRQDSTQDENGDWVSGAAPVEKQYECRYEPNVRNRVIPGADGSKTDFAGTVYLQTSDIIATGTSFILTRENGSVIKGQVKGADPRQLNCKVWI